jgi:hypothetical protein
MSEAGYALFFVSPPFVVCLGQVNVGIKTPKIIGSWVISSIL